MWVIVYRPLAGEKIYGPYETAARASGAALSAFGENPRYGLPFWRVQRLEEL